MNKFCVYLHIDNSGDIFYVGQGTHRRAHSTTALGRAAKWYEISKEGFDVLIAYDNLSKEEAVRLEKETIIKLREQKQPLVNVSLNDGVRTLTREMFENIFEISDDSKFGLIWKRNTRTKKLIGKSAGCINKKTGYVVATVEGIQYFLHRVVMALHLGECPSNMQVNHIDGNKTNNRISNLELVTPQQNVRHAYDSGLAKGKSGEDNPMSEITEEVVLKIYEYLEQGLGNTEISKLLDIEHKHISLLRTGSRWKHIYEKYGKTFKQSQTPKVHSKEQVKQAWYLVKEGKLTNKEISEITSVERSQVSRIRHRKAFIIWLDEFEEELANQ